MDNCNLSAHLFLDQNQRVFVYEDNEWTVKGRYETALEDDEDAIWTYENGGDLLRFLIVSNLLFFFKKI